MAGADVLFVEPSGKAGDVGVTVSPVRIKSLEQFGDLKAVGDRLLAAESSKVDTFDLLKASWQGCEQFQCARAPMDLWKRLAWTPL